MELPGLLPHYVEIMGFSVSQTLITGVFSTLFFGIFILVYNIIKSRNPANTFIHTIEIAVEGLLNFFHTITDGLPNYAKLYVIFLFFYILWNNYFGLVGDLFSTVYEPLHHVFRPVTSDIYFNLILAVAGVLLPLFYGFSHHGFHFIEKYFPVRGMGVLTGGTGIKGFFMKIGDIFLGLFVGLLELIGEFARIISLTLRLFGNIFAGVVILMLLVGATVYLVKIPFLSPILILIFETLVGLIQALVFSLLVSVYFKVAGESH